MATFRYAFQGDVDLWTNPSVVLNGSPPPAGSDIISAGYHMVIRAHANAATGARSYVTLSNGSTSLTSPTVSASSVTTDPSWPEWRRQLTFDGVFNKPASGTFSSFFQGKSSLWLGAVGYDSQLIPGGVADLLSLTVTALTDQGWVARYYDGSKWQSAGVYERTADGWEKREIRYYTGTTFL